MASVPADPLHILQSALAAQANSKEQADLLSTLRESLESHPAPIPILVGTLVGIIVNAGDSLLKRWVIDLLHYAICRSPLSVEQRTQMASQSLDTLAQLLDDPNPAIVKVVIQCLTGVYPLLFRLLCTNRSNPAAWTTLSTCKARILEIVWTPNVGMGMKLSAVKFLQRVILVQMRGIPDPRLQNKNDPNIAMCPADHPFISAPKLEAEGQKLFEATITLLYSSQNMDILSALINSWSNLVKLRPAIVSYVVSSLKSWTPAALLGLSASSIRSVEKAIRILLTHMSRNPALSQHAGQINEALTTQAARMDKAAAEEKKRKAAAADSRKRPLSAAAEQPTDAKRPKLEQDGTQPAPFLSSFDFTALPAALITELIVANLDAFTEAALLDLVQVYRQTRNLSTPTPATAASTSQPAPTSAPPVAPQQESQTPEPQRAPTPPAAVPTPAVKDEPVDPLQMDIDQDEIEYEPDKLNEELSGGSAAAEAELAGDVDTITTDLKLIDFKLPPPKELSEDERYHLIGGSLSRIWAGAEELKAHEISLPEGSQQVGQSATDMWMLLIVRMITRVAKPPLLPSDEEDFFEKEQPSDEFYARQDQLRHTLCNYIMDDFPSRVRLATTWMNEEWYNDQIRAGEKGWQPNYETWLNQIVASYQTLFDGKDRTFSRFLLDLPTIPSDVLGLLRELCIDSTSSDRMQVGFTTLRGLVIQRPSLRADALTVLLELTTHPEKKTRMAAINTVKLWVPHTQPMSSTIQEFALQMLRKLQLRPQLTNDSVTPTPRRESQSVAVDSLETQAETASDHAMEVQPQDEKMEDAKVLTERTQEDLVHTPYLPERIELPAQKSQVLQHVELLFALSVKVPTFLDEIFAAYGQMDTTVQEAIQDLITALIRSLGQNHGKLLTLLRTFPPGAESLALRVLTIFTESGRPSTQLVALIKALVNERDLDARFLIPIIGEMDKADIMRHLPRIVSMLNNQPEPKNLVRQVFSTIVAPPPHSFGTVSSNQPRVQQSEVLTPQELMVLLHEKEREIGLKSTIEAINICLSMTDVFRAEVLGAVMQQILDEPVLPTLFLRTVIQIVTTYKTHLGFVTSTLLARLITKKIWTNPQLWEGFILCAKATAPASFGALLQLPNQQLKELVDKQPSLKVSLREYISNNKKSANKARQQTLLEIIGEPPEQQ
ncbi:hypothetical protein AX16_001475 [Volvariella volvacea WC 439]|nr:hypothetical protein AX16_001475 [Volvariella volvacea WC 439]